MWSDVFWVYVGQCSSTMEHMGYRTGNYWWLEEGTNSQSGTLCSPPFLGSALSNLFCFADLVDGPENGSNSITYITLVRWSISLLFEYVYAGDFHLLYSIHTYINPGESSQLPDTHHHVFFPIHQPAPGPPRCPPPKNTSGEWLPAPPPDAPGSESRASPRRPPPPAAGAGAPAWGVRSGDGVLQVVWVVPVVFVWWIFQWQKTVGTWDFICLSYSFLIDKLV